MSNRFLFAVLRLSVCNVCLLLVSIPTVAQQNPGPVPSDSSQRGVVRELYVPFEDLDALLGEHTERVYMTREEFEQLKLAAEQKPEVSLPLKLALLAADYRATISDGRALLHGELLVEVLESGLQVLPLPLAGVGMQSASLDGQPASLARDASGNTLLFVNGAGRHELSIQLVSPVATAAAQQTLKLRLPTAPSSTFTMSVPGNVEIKSGPSVIARQVDEKRNVTTFQLLPSPEPMSIVMSLNNRKLREQNTVMARGVLVAEVTAAYEQLYATMSMSVLNGASDEFRFAVDDELEVNRVSCEQLSRWRVESVDGMQQLVVTLRAPTTERVVISVGLDRKQPRLEDWRLARFQPLDVAGYTTVVGLVTEDRLRVARLQPEGLFSIDSQVLATALSPSLFAAEQGAPLAQIRAAFYAASADYDLTAQLELPQGGLVVNANTVLSVSDEGLSVAGGLSLLPENEKLFFIDFIAPPDWNVMWIKDGIDSEIKFERFDDAAGTRIHVGLPSGYPAGSAATIWFEARRTPAGWLDDWETQTVEFPAFTVLNAREQKGVIAVQVKDDLQATPVATQNLVVVSDSEKAKHQLADTPTALAYRYYGPGWQAQIDITPTQPRVTARVLSFYSLDDESLRAHHEVIFLIDRAHTKQLQFSLPDSTPSEVRIAALEGARIKETSSSIGDGRRIWTVELAERHAGSVRLAIDFTQRLEVQELAEDVQVVMELPVARAVGVEYQTGAISIEGHAELDVRVMQSPRAVDIGELVDAEYQVGKQLLGAFGYVGFDDRIMIELARRPVHPLPTTIVERANLETNISSEGLCQTDAQFQLRTKAGYLEVRLPPDAILWSAYLDGKPGLPQRENQRVLISLPANANSDLRSLRLVYETPARAIRLRGEVDIAAPELYERDSRERPGAEVPIADLEWQLVLPTGYRVVRSDGGYQGAKGSATAFERVLDILSKLGGGTRRNSVPEAFDIEFTGGNDSALDGERELLSQELSRRISPSGTEQVPATAAPAQPMSEAIDEDRMNYSAQAAEETAETEQAVTPARPAITRARDWAREGFRSLAIHLANRPASETLELETLGTQASTRLTLINGRRYDWLASAIGILIFLWGLTRKTWSTRASYLFLLLIAVLLAPALTGWTAELGPIEFGALSAGVALLAYYLLQSLFQAVGARWQTGNDNGVTSSTSTASSASRVTMHSVVFLAAVQFTANSGLAQSADPFGSAPSGDPFGSQPVEHSLTPEQFINSPEQFRKFWESLIDMGPIPIPAGAVVVPYDPERELILSAVAETERLLVPFATYERLWNLAYPDQQLHKRQPPAQFAWSGAAYSTTLAVGPSLSMTGKLRLEQFVDDALLVPLPIAGCILERATIDGASAKLQLLQPRSRMNAPSEPVPLPTQAAASPARQLEDQALASTPSGGLLMLYTSGKGVKEIELRLRWKLERSGGWRMVEGQVPAAPATALTISIEQPNTELRLTGLTDRTAYTTTEANEVLKTALDYSGRFGLRWRDKISEAAIDQGLTVQSRAVFDVREDALKLAWHGDFQFRRDRREAFRLAVPKDYLIEKIVGNNVRGWSTQTADESQYVDVELLKAAVEHESLTVLISKQTAIEEGQTREFTVPEITVPEAMLQQGQLTIRRSALVDLRAAETVGVSRVDLPDESGWLAEHEPSSPLPLVPYQAYQFSQPAFQLALAAVIRPTQMTVEAQSLVKISQLETLLETRLQITAEDRPLYHLKMRLPAGLQLDSPQLPGAFQWDVRDDNGAPLLEIYMADGLTGTFSILLRGELRSGAQQAVDPTIPIAPVVLPEIELLNARRQSGEIVVQADPAYDIRPTNLQGCEVALLSVANSWLSEQQQRLARIVIRYPAPGYSGELAVTQRAPFVSSFTVTNVKVTDRVVEETIYIEASITSAGISEFLFQLPAEMAEARIQAPLVRQETRIPIAGDPNAAIRVRLELQDAIMGRFAVLVEHDRLLTAGPQPAPLPLVETGTTTMRMVTLENASRDELLTREVVSLERMERGDLQQQKRLNMLGGESAIVFRVREDLANTAAPLLTFETTSRQTVETSGARIGLAQTLLVVDHLGGYRGTHEFRVENRTEPFLEIALPSDSRLWTVQVAGQPVKPSTSSNASNYVRIPLIKSAEGDLDYPVVLKYGGSLPRPSLFAHVVFPLIKAVNINVDLSQVRLRLPEDYHWFQFDGTLGRVESENDLQAGWLSFRTKQISELAQLLGSSGKIYSKVRAQNNLKQLEAAFEQQNPSTAMDQLGGKQSEFGRQLAAGAMAMQQAQQQVAEFEKQNSAADVIIGNRFLLADMYGRQDNGRATNVVSELGSNFASGPGSDSAESLSGNSEPSIGDSKRFDSGWLRTNELQTFDKEEDESRLSKDQLSPRQAGRESGVAGKLQASSRPATTEPAAEETAQHSNDLRSEQQQLAGDYRQQAERYQRRLEESRADAAAQTQSGFGTSQNGQPAAPSGGPHAAGGYGGAGDYRYTGPEENRQVDSTGAMAGAVVGGTGQGGEAGMEGTDRAGQDFDPTLGVPQFRDAQNRPAIAQPGSGIVNWATPAGTTETLSPSGGAYLASLDVQLPVRGREFLFSTPGGDLQLTARGMSSEIGRRMLSILMIAALAVLLIGIYRAMRYFARNLGLRKLMAACLGMVGVASIVFGLWPIYGLLATVAAVTTFIAANKP